MTEAAQPSEQPATPREPGVGQLGWLAQPVDVASLAVFRILFGLFAAGEAYRLVASQHVFNLWMDTPVFFPWLGFAWLPKPPGLGMVIHFYLLALVGLALAGGLWFRGAAILLCLGFAYPLLLCETAFLSELYLFALVALLLAVTPANRALSADAWLRPRRRGESVPRICLLLLRAQFSIVQLSMGVWMLNPDWLRGWPLHLWLPTRTGLPLIGQLHALAPIIVTLSWLLAFAFIAAPLALWWRRTRLVGFALLAPALVWLGQSFDLGALTWLLLIGNLLFLPPGWPRRVFNWPPLPVSGTQPAGNLAPALAALALAWVAIQVIVPLRAAFISGDSAWREQGTTFAWRVPGPSKVSVVTFSIRNPETDETRSFDPKGQVSAWQYARLAGNPALLRRYAIGIARHQTAAGQPTPEIRALTLVSLNGREPQRLIDPRVDLVQAPPPGSSAAAWILALEIPLSQQWKTDGDWLPPRDALP